MRRTHVPVCTWKSKDNSGAQCAPFTVWVLVIQSRLSAGEPSHQSNTTHFKHRALQCCTQQELNPGVPVSCSKASLDCPKNPICRISKQASTDAAGPGWTCGPGLLPTWHLAALLPGSHSLSLPRPQHWSSVGRAGFSSSPSSPQRVLRGLHREENRIITQEVKFLQFLFYFILF